MARLLIVVSGASATGKTTLVSRLSNELTIPLISKDGIKEYLFDTLPQSDRDWSTTQGKAAIAMMYAGAKELLMADSPVFIESLFHVDYAKPDIESLTSQTDAHLLELHCYVPHTVRQKRWKERSLFQRHSGHLDDPNKDLPVVNAEPLFPNSAIILDNSDPISAYDDAKKFISEQLLKINGGVYQKTN